MAATVPIVHPLSFDIEDWFHILGVPALEDAGAWSALPSIVERETEAILALLDAHGVRATFFVVGWIAERYPGLVGRIAAQGHEIASHSYWHRPVFSHDEASFREDLRRSLDAIQHAAQVRVEGYRAPSFSIVPGVEWALDALLDAGLAYDASLFPVPRRHGGYPCPRAAHQVATPSGRRIAALPMSLMRLGPRLLGFSGGGYFRLLPFRLIERALVANEAEGLATVIYLHPRDFTTDWPLATLPISRRWQARVGCEGCRGKLDALLARHRFGTCRDYLRETGTLTVAAS